MADWYPRFGDIPDIGFATPSSINPKGLPGYGDKPVETAYGVRYKEPMWATEDGVTSASPAFRYLSPGSQLPPDADADWIAEHTYAALELPGIATDYHFKLLAAEEALWNLRQKDLGASEHLEQLCLLDLRLIEVLPDIVCESRGNGDDLILSVPSFGYLISLYEKNGMLQEALNVSLKSDHFRQHNSSTERLRTAVANQAEEDAA